VQEQNVVARILDTVFRRQVDEPETPICPDHKVEMNLRGKMGRPTRFADTQSQTYTHIFFCPVPGCDHSKERQVSRKQIAVPGEPPRRPVFARRGGR
jgi:hypothetical protein